MEQYKNIFVTILKCIWWFVKIFFGTLLLVLLADYTKKELKEWWVK